LNEKIEQTNEQEDPFLIELPKLLGQTERNLGFRLTSKGVFVTEGFEHYVIESYQRWLKEQTGKENTKNEEKCRKRLFGENPKSFYLLDGKKCFFGVFLKGKAETINNSLKNKIHLTAYRGEPIDPKDFLHPKDPYLEKIKNIRIHFSPSQGSFIKVSSKKSEFKIPFEQLRSFAKQARLSEEFCKKYPKAKFSLRECITPLAQILRNSRASKPGSSLFALREHLKLKPNKIAHSAGFSFFFNKEGILLACVQSKNKEFRRKIKEEITALKTKHPLTSIRGFTLLNGKSKHLGKVRIKGNSFFLEPRCFFHFTKLLLRQKKTDTFIGTKGVMQKLISALQSSKDASPEAEKEFSGGRRISGKNYRVSGKWVFVIQDKNCISGVFINKSKNRKPGNKQKKHQQKKAPANKSTSASLN